MLAEMKHEMQVIKRNLKETYDKHNIEVDQHRALKKFKVGEHVYFHINPKRSSLGVGSCEKLQPQYCGPFEILQRIGPVAYRHYFPPSVNVHDVFHVSLCKICTKY